MVTETIRLTTFGHTETLIHIKIHVVRRDVLFPLERNKECANLIVETHVIPAHNTNEFQAMMVSSAPLLYCACLNKSEHKYGLIISDPTPMQAVGTNPQSYWKGANIKDLLCRHTNSILRSVLRSRPFQ